jgi:predicted dienelactone hydrolase
MMHARKIIRIITAVIILMLVKGSARNAEASPQDDQGQSSEQQQSASFVVGHATRVLNVPGTLGENRPVNVELWYPARGLHDCDVSEGGDGNADCSATPASYTSRLYGVPLLPQWTPLSWTIGTSDAFENLRVSNKGPFPVVVFSHAGTSNSINYAYTLEGLASHGFIVAAPDHVNDTQDDVRIDFINAQAKQDLIPCYDGLPSPCSRGADVPRSMTDRAHDVSAVLDALPTWFGERVDMTRVGIMGHSRGTVTALAAAGGSTTWGFPAEPRVKAIMGLAIGVHDITFGANLEDVTVPALLVAGGLDPTLPVSQDAFDKLASTEKEIVLIENAKHRHFISGLCAQTQSSGAIAQADSRAILDLQTAKGLLAPFPLPAGVAMDFCSFDTFTAPTDIRPLVTSLTGFNFASTNVPTTGLSSDKVKEQAVELAVAFFGRVL